MKLLSTADWKDLYLYGLVGGEPIGWPTGFNPDSPLFAYRDRLKGKKARYRQGYAWTLANYPSKTTTLPGGTPAIEWPNYYAMENPQITLAGEKVGFVCQHFYSVPDGQVRANSFGIYNGPDGGTLRFLQPDNSYVDVPATNLRLPYKLIGALRVHGADIAVTDSDAVIVPSAPAVMAYGGLLPAKRQCWLIDGCDKVIAGTLTFSWSKPDLFASAVEMSGGLSVVLPAGAALLVGDSGSTLWALDDTGVLFCVGVWDSSQPMAQPLATNAAWNALGTVPQIVQTSPRVGQFAQFSTVIEAPTAQISGRVISGYNLTPGWFPTWSPTLSGAISETITNQPDGRSWVGYLIDLGVPTWSEPQKRSAVKQITAAAAPIQLEHTSSFPTVEITIATQPVWLLDAPVGSVQRIINSSASPLTVKSRGVSTDEVVATQASGTSTDYQRLLGNLAGGNPKWKIVVVSAAPAVESPILSVFGRVGAVVAVANDYNAEQVAATAPSFSGSSITTQRYLDAIGAKTLTPSGPARLNGASAPVSFANLTAFSVALGTVASTACAGDDARLSDARTPSSHAASHTSGGGDVVTLAQSQVTGLVALLALLAPLASPALSGAPTTPTAAGGTNNTQIASTAFVQAAIALLVNSAPGVLDQLNEIAAALGNDPNFATTITTLLAGKAALAHAHLQSDVTGLVAALADKAALAHVHAQADVTGLVALLATLAPLASPAFSGGVTFPNGGIYLYDISNSLLMQVVLADELTSNRSLTIITNDSSPIFTLTGTCSLAGNNTGDQTSIVGITGTIAQFNTACTDADFTTGGGTCSGDSSRTNTGDQTSIVGITGTLDEFNTALTGANFSSQGRSAATASFLALN